MIFVELYARANDLEHDSGLTVQVPARIPMVIADVLTRQRDLMRPNRAKTEPEAPIKPESIWVFIHVGDKYFRGNMPVDYFIKITGLQMQVAQDYAMVAEMKRLIAGYVRSGKRVEILPV